MWASYSNDGYWDLHKYVYSLIQKSMRLELEYFESMDIMFSKEYSTTISQVFIGQGKYFKSRNC